eukprot:PLAT15148.1.p1 GENE.PLAT15148.1~~PLAT15148.1.p1  ORF type:complete len:939 (-),score=504.02 PLAT15148.1:184-3000(-)
MDSSGKGKSGIGSTRGGSSVVTRSTVGRTGRRSKRRRDMRSTGMGRSRLHASRLSASTTRSRGGGGGDGGPSSIAVLLDGRDVTPQSLLVSDADRAAKGKGRGGRGGGGGGVGGSSAMRSVSSGHHGLSSGGGGGTGPSSGPSGSVSGSSGDVLDHIPTGFSDSALSGDSGSDDDGGTASRDDGVDGLVAELGVSTVREDEELGGRGHADGEGDGGGTEEDMDEPITLTLTETPTIMLLHVAGRCVAQDSKEHPLVTEQKREYEEMLEGRVGSDLYVARAAQTLNYAPKTKEVMVFPPATRDVGATATLWDIYDSYAVEDSGEADLHELELSTHKRGGSKKTALGRQVEEVVAASLATPGCLIDVESGRAAKPRIEVSTSLAATSAHGSSRHSGMLPASGAVGSSSGVHVGSSSFSGGTKEARGHITVALSEDVWAEGKDVKDVIAARESARVMYSSALLHALRTVECAIQQNLYHSKHLIYRDFPLALMDEALDDGGLMGGGGGGGGGSSGLAGVGLVAGSFARRGPRLERLWSFQCPLTVGHSVSCMEWNKVNQDMLAVSYGQSSFGKQTSGLILFWSLKNPEFPEKVVRVASGVMSIAFSTAHPNLLAAGYYDGTVAVYDLRREDSQPSVESKHTAGKHTEPVWQVKWVDKGSERGETLVSISTDGRVVEWSMKKGMTAGVLMLLKRMPNLAPGADSKREGIIARHANGLCFDFPIDDSSVYFAGTEDGIIHKCSCSYEEYLTSYYGHTAAVHRIRSSPFWPAAFLSCSEDWTVRLWNGKDEAPVLSFRPVDLSNVVTDISWSPHTSTIFASVTGDGRIQVWDLEASVLDPVITHYPKPSELPPLGEEAEEEATDAMRAAYDAARARMDSDEPTKVTSVLFAYNAPVVVTGDEHGAVNVYRLYEMEKAPLTVDQQVDRLQHVMYPDGADVAPARE